MTIVNKIDTTEHILLNLQNSIIMIFDSLRHLNTTGLDRELYCIDRNSAYRMTICFYNIFTEDKMPDLAVYIVVLKKYMIYLERYRHFSVLESFLLYKPPCKDPNSALAVVLLKFIRNTGINNSPSYEAAMTHQLTTHSSQFPAVAALLDEPLRELPPDRDDKVRVCALPGCNIDGKGLFNKMMKCGRCHNVYYCGTRHQKQHWKEHKQTCGSSTAVSCFNTSSTIT